MLINQWYAAMPSGLLGDYPQQARMLGQDFVLFRDPTGQPHCLSDICIHRGASLAAGQTVGHGVECPYHGWRFDGGGRCRLVPAQGQGGKIPARARIDAYPTVEHYGLIWCFLGDLPEAQRPPLPDLFPEYEHPEDWRFLHGQFTWKANWTRVVENGIDVSHAHFVHPDFGDRNNPEIPDYTVSEDDWGAAMTSQYPPRPKRGLLALLLKKRKRPVGLELAVQLSGPSTRLALQMNSRMRMVIFAAHLPVDEERTVSHWVMARNFLRKPIFDGDSRRRVAKIFSEDAAVIHRVKPVIVPDGLADELTVKSDALGYAFRRMVRRRSAEGHEIDLNRLKAEAALDKVARVIPSPPRGRDPKGWVLRPVPLIPPKDPSGDVVMAAE